MEEKAKATAEAVKETPARWQEEVKPRTEADFKLAHGEIPFSTQEVLEGKAPGDVGVAAGRGGPAGGRDEHGLGLGSLLKPDASSSVTREVPANQRTSDLLAKVSLHCSSSTLCVHPERSPARSPAERASSAVESAAL